MPIRKILERYARLDDAAADVVETVGSVLRWPWVACWLPAPETSLRLQAAWGDFADLIRASRLWTPRRTEGCVGRCWTRQRTFSSTDLVADMSLSRSLVAHRQGLRAGAWIPITGARSTLGVLELLTVEVDDLARERIAIAESVGVDLGQRYEPRG